LKQIKKLNIIAGNIFKARQGNFTANSNLQIPLFLVFERILLEVKETFRQESTISLRPPNLILHASLKTGHSNNLTMDKAAFLCSFWRYFIVI
jgi:hypothetical protein